MESLKVTQSQTIFYSFIYEFTEQILIEPQIPASSGLGTRVAVINNQAQNCLQVIFNLVRRQILNS